MKTALTLLKELGIDAIVLLAGIAGGFVFVNKNKELSWLQKLTTMLSGGLIANYLTPIVGDWINSSGNPLYGLAFFLGFGGKELVEFLLSLLKNKVSSSNQK